MTKQLLSVLVLCLAGLPPLAAGTLYVPVAKNQEVGGKMYQTEVWVANPSDAPRQFSVQFLPTLSDGTAIERTSQPIAVAPRSTFFISSAVSAGQSGMIEITSDPELVFQAELVPVDADRQLGAGARLPLLSSENMSPAGSTAHIVGLARDASGTVSNVGIINLGRDPAQCGINVFHASGQQIGGKAVVNLKPLSLNEYPQALALLGIQVESHVRLDVTCNADFYAYGTIFGEDPRGTEFLPPATTADSSLVAPGDEPQAAVLSKPGTFFIPKNGASELIVPLPLEPGVFYDRAVIDFDLLVDRFQSNLFHGIVGMNQPGGEGLYFGMFVRGDRRKTTLDLGKEQGFTQTSTNIWSEKTAYHLRFDYDTVSGELHFQNFRGTTNTLLEEYTVPVNSFNIIDDGRKVQLVFGLRKISDGAYFPPINWRFSNLEVQVFPQAP